MNANQEAVVDAAIRLANVSPSWLEQVPLLAAFEALCPADGLRITKDRALKVLADEVERLRKELAAREC